MRVLALGVFLTLTMAACLRPAGTLFETTVSQPDGSYPMPVALGDQTGIVTAIEPALGDSSARTEPLVEPDPADAKNVLVSWIGGACDNDVALSLQRSGSTFALHLDVHGKLGLGCPAVGLIRGLRIRFSEPIRADAINPSG
jgi:hypothetical protein